MVLIVEVDRCYAGKGAAGSIRGADTRYEERKGHFIDGRVLLLKAAEGGLQWKSGAYGNAIKRVAIADIRLLSPDVSAAEGGDGKAQGVLYSFPANAVAGLVHVFDIEASEARLPTVASAGRLPYLNGLKQEIGTVTVTATPAASPKKSAAKRGNAQKTAQTKKQAGEMKVTELRAALQPAAAGLVANGPQGRTTIATAASRGEGGRGRAGDATTMTMTTMRRRRRRSS
jgi:hypothetical protein